MTETARYNYIDANGKRLATKVRYVPKTFRWFVPTSGEGEAQGLGNLSQTDLPLFQLVEVLNAKPEAFVYYCEGEADALNVKALGLVGTTSPEGAGVKNLPRSRFEALRGRHVVLLPDNDKPGREYMERVAELLRDVAASVRTLNLPGLEEKHDVSDWIKQGGTADQLNAMAEAHGADMWQVQPHDVRSGAAIADDVEAALKRFVVLPEEAAVACVLWLFHTHAFEASEAFTPYLAIQSPTRAAGKTTLLDVLFTFAAEPVRADSARAAAVYRLVDRGRGIGKVTGRIPSLFLDELDAVFGGGTTKSETAEALRLILNSGFKRDGAAIVCDGDNNEPRSFATWCPKVLAGIGKLPDTVSDRSIPIRMARATREELAHIESARHRTLAALHQLREEVADWALLATPTLRLRPEQFAGLSARQDDIWGPLLNIADELGGDWPARARWAASALHKDTGDTTDGRDPGTALLADLRDIFTEDRAEFVSSARLAELLRVMEDRPWPEYTRGGPISLHSIARLLGAYEISPRLSRTTGIDGKRLRGYHLEDCREAFRRYLPPVAGEVYPECSTGGPTPSSPSVASMNTLRAPKCSEPSHEVFAEEVSGVAVPLAAAGYPADWD